MIERRRARPSRSAAPSARRPLAAVVLVAWLGQRAAGLVQVQGVALDDALAEFIRLLGVADALVDGDIAALVDLARIVERALLAALVDRVVDRDHLAGGGVLDRGPRGAADDVARRGVA